MTMLEKENAVKRFVWTVAVAIPVAVALLFFIPPAENLSEETRQAMYVLPQINAWFNGTAFFCLIGALIAIKNKNVPLHRAFNTVALSLSVLFLFSSCFTSSYAEESSTVSAPIKRFAMKICIIT